MKMVNLLTVLVALAPLTSTAAIKDATSCNDFPSLSAIVNAGPGTDQSEAAKDAIKGVYSNDRGLFLRCLAAIESAPGQSANVRQIVRLTYKLVYADNSPTRLARQNDVNPDALVNEE